MTFQFKSLLNSWFTRCDSSEWVLGIVYKTEGPCYRKAGAIMFFNGDGEHFGLLSGGCLEADIHQHARRVIQSGQGTTLCYDGSDEDDISFQLGIGCGGTVYVALLPITHKNNYLQLKEIHQILEQRKSGVFELKIPGDNDETQTRFVPDLEGCRTDIHAKLITESTASWLRVGIKPDPHLLVIGGGVDAKPVVSIARELGWETTLWDSRPANARREHFMSANTILECSVERLSEYASDQRVDAAILMSHNIALDAAALMALSRHQFKYLGLLGPTSRKQRVVEAANLTEAAIKTELVGPAGFDLGGELPESIALSMISECHAHINGCTGSSASRKP
jgi:xanthine dehydrogenase accessory factor